MPENDWSGVVTDEDGLSVSFEGDPFAWDTEVVVDSDFDEDGEIILSVIEVVEGSRSLFDAAERLIAFGNKLHTLSYNNWEVVSDWSEGFATAVQFEVGSDYE